MESGLWKKAYAKGLKKLVKDKKMTATEISCGFDTFPTGEKIQIFLKICHYSDQLLATNPETGGLLCNRKWEGEQCK